MQRNRSGVRGTWPWAYGVVTEVGEGDIEWFWPIVYGSLNGLGGKLYLCTVCVGRGQKRRHLGGGRWTYGAFWKRESPDVAKSWILYESSIFRTSINNSGVSGSFWLTGSPREWRIPFKTSTKLLWSGSGSDHSSYTDCLIDRYCVMDVYFRVRASTAAYLHRVVVEADTGGISWWRKRWDRKPCDIYRRAGWRGHMSGADTAWSHGWGRLPDVLLYLGGDWKQMGQVQFT